MLRRHALTDDQWKRIQELLPGKAGDPGGTAQDNRLFVDAVFWIARTGAPWRDLPERFGKWNSVFTRFNRWSQAGVWLRVMDALQDPDLEWLFVDSSVIRAHQQAAGAKKGDQQRKPWGARAGGSAPNCTSRRMAWAIRFESP
jgi:transposase